MTTDLARAEAALERLMHLHPKLIDLGLDRGLGLLAKLGNPHLNLPPVIHVAGTNGKGSTLAFIRAMIEASGKTCHGYSSPHLVRFHERIRVAGALINDRDLADLLEEVEAINGDDPMTFFEITTAAAMLAFQRHHADATLLETGLGGRADSTNVIPKPAVTIITPIARDHEHFLGDNLAAIAREKAGIMRKDVACFTAKQHPEALASLKDHARVIGAPLYLADQDFFVSRYQGGVKIDLPQRQIILPELGLRGDHQTHNAGLAVAGLIHAFPRLNDDALVMGAKQVEWPGRIQPLNHGDLVNTAYPDNEIWLDGAHNAHGAEALANTLAQLKDHPWVLICGALNTRDPQDFLRPLKPVVDHVITLTIPNQDAALDNSVIAKAAMGLGYHAETAADLKSAVKTAYDHAHESGASIIIAGSLYLAGHVLATNGTLPQ